MKKQKKIITFLISLSLIFSLCTMPLDAAYKVQHGDAAKALWEDGLFLGSSGSFDLDKPLTRAAGSTMIVRLLGKETEAKTESYTIPFTDVASWAKPYVGYCYKNGIVNGIGKNTFGSNDNMTATQYLTLVLRALGYNDKAGDFSWDKAHVKALEIGLIDQTDYTKYTTSTQFLRDDAADIAYAALSQKIKGTDTFLKSTITLPGRPEGDMPCYTTADTVTTTDPKTVPADSVNVDGWLNVSIGIKTESTTTKPSSWPQDADNISQFIGNGYASTLSWMVGPDESIHNPSSTLYAASGTAKLYSYWVVTEPDKVDLAIICDGKKIHTVKDFAIKTGDYVDIILSVDTAKLSANLGKGDHKISIGITKPKYIDGKFAYEDTKVKATYNIGTGVKGATFKLSKGLDGSKIYSSYLYAGGQTYGVRYFFTLETGKYSGKYTMSFPADNGTDTQTFTVEPNSIYHITYTYGIKYSASYSYTYKFNVKLTGPQSVTLSFSDKHPGKMNTGSIKITKQ